MRAIISGQAGVAAIVQGNEAELIRLDQPTKSIKIPNDILHYHFQYANDIVVNEMNSRENILRKLVLCRKFDQALQLTLVLLDINETVEISKLAAEYLEEFFQNQEILDFVLNRLYSAPIPVDGNIEKAIRSSHDRSRVQLFLKDLNAAQSQIYRFYRAWESISLELFRSPSEKDEFREALIAGGVLKDLAMVGMDANKFGLAHIKALSLSKSFNRYREILNLWLSGLKPEKNKSFSIPVEREPKTVGDGEYDVQINKKTISNFQVFSSVEKQKQGIVENIRNGRIEIARKYIEELIDMQKKHSAPEHIAKSLCDLAQEAKKIYNYSFQLELTLRAVDIAPRDGWSHGQLADAYFCLHKLNDAINSYENAIACGQERFGYTGLAKILLEKGDFESSFTAFDEVKTKFPDESAAWSGFAEVLRRMWWLDLALTEYEAAIKKFPDVDILRCGKAATLTDKGLLEDALKEYNSCIKSFGESSVAINGKGTVLRKMGKYSEALRLYNFAMKKFSHDFTLNYCKAKTLVDMEKYREALDSLNLLCDRYPYEPQALMAKAEIFKTTKQYEKAIEVYSEASVKFPENKFIANGKASVYKKQGAYKKALQAYEINLSRAPYDIIAKAGKADLLKELGEFKSALDIYDELIEKNPNKRAFQHTKASILITLEDYEKAEALLQFEENPTTQDDWMAFHVRTVLLLKRNKFKEATQLIEYALRKTPFFKVRSYFKNIQVIAKLRERKFREATTLLAGKDTPIANILLMHAYGELAKEDASKMDKAKIAKQCLDVDCPPHLIPLMIELENRYFSNNQDNTKDEEWLFQQECNSGLLFAV